MECVQNQEVILEWERKLQAAMEQLPDRPRRLLVILNPYGGSQSARRVWDLTVHPIFQLAGAQQVNSFNMTWISPLT